MRPAQGDFSQWVDLFNHLDAYLEDLVKSRRDIALERAVAEPFPESTCLQVLRVTTLLLDNCSNRQQYGSVEVLRRTPFVLPASRRAACTVLKPHPAAAAPHHAAGGGQPGGFY